jgi:hypothetical protein
MGDEQSAALAARAGDHLHRAGRRAHMRGDDSTAAKLLDRAIALMPAGKPRRQALVTLGLCSRDEPTSPDWLALARRLADEARDAGDELDGLKAACSR